MSVTSIVLIVIAALVLFLHLYRQWWSHRDLRQVHTAPFEGELFRVGETFISRRAGGDRSRTIIGFPGFLEDMRYFQEVYRDVDCELIAVNNANYHCPFPGIDAQSLDWPANPHPLGTIEHDAFYLAQVVRELASGSDIILHGHSRGGAVVLEMGRQFPELALSEERNITAILEAAVLPQGRNAGKGSDPVPHRIICYLLPVVLGLSRKTGPEQLLKNPMMRPTNELKSSLCLSVFTVARNYSTCVTNVQSIVRWQKTMQHDLYNNYRKITAVIGERDDVLDNPTMIASAEAGAALNPGMTVLRTTDTNHFPSLEQPHYLRELVAS